MTTSALPPTHPVLHNAPAVAHIVDVADGIDRVMGDRALYLRMVKRFRNDYQHGAVPIGTALTRRDTAMAQRMAHTLKGAAGMIGAHSLHQHAAALEQAIRTDSGLQASALAALHPAMADVLAALDVLLGTVPGEEEAAPRTLLPDQDLLAQLIDMLTDGDGAAVDLLEASGASLKAILGEARLAQVAVAVNDFDFEEALRALRHGQNGKQERNQV